MKSSLLHLFFGLISASVLAQPVINKNPISQTLCLDACANLVVGAVGVGSSLYTYQWQTDAGGGFSDYGSGAIGFDTLEICGSTMSAPTIVNFRCIVTDTSGFSDTSNAAIVTVDSCLLPVADFVYEFSSVTSRCFENKSKHANSITWSFGDGATDNIENPCHEYDSQWYFDVTLYAFNDYGSDKKTVSLDLLSVQELSSEFKIYPTVFSDQVTMKFSTYVDEMLMYDLSGKIVNQMLGVGKSTQINTGNLKSGIYFVRVTSSEDVYITRLVKP